ncbi:MAG: hypothetical protein E7496_05005 [Ruminococcus sp.]|nr:hypothetical protein [Ruminococcus sp.]
MKYIYTVFRDGDGYAWGENTPQNFSEITHLLQQCESISHVYYIFHRGNVLEVRKAESPESKERLFFVYTVDDFRNEDGVFSADTRNKAWSQIIENFLTDCPPFHRTDCTPEQVPGLLQSFARHLPEKLTSGLLIDEDSRQNYRFFDTSREKIICDTDSFRFLRKLPIFTGENRIFRAMCFRYGAPAVSMLEFIAMLSADLTAQANGNMTAFRKSFEKYFDPCMISKSIEYLLLSSDEAFIQEVQSKLDSGIALGFGIDREFIRSMTAWYLASYGIHEVQELRQFLHLFSCFGLPEELLLPVLRRWEQEYDSHSDKPLFLKKTEVLNYPEFVRTVTENQSRCFLTDEVSHETLDKIYACIQEKGIPASVLENLFQENRKDKIISDLLEFVSWSEHPEDAPKHPEKNLLPALLYWSELVSDAELLNFYGEKNLAGQMKQDAYQVRIPARIRNQPEISRNLLLADKLSEKYRLNAVFQKGKLGRTEKRILAVSLISFLLILVSCIRLVMVMLYEC